MSLTTGCSTLDLFSTLTGGGGNSGVSVPIEAQVGRENTKQVVVGDQVSDNATQNNSKVDVEEAKEVTVNESPSLWFMILFALGWFLPSPTVIGNWVGSLFVRKS